jgi:protein phosphatase
VTCVSQFRWTSAACTDVGRVRERNEDACLDLPERGIWAVADGMGGHAVGDFASRAIVQALSALPEPDSLDGAVENARRPCRPSTSC